MLTLSWYQFVFFLCGTAELAFGLEVPAVTGVILAVFDTGHLVQAAFAVEECADFGGRKNKANGHGIWFAINRLRGQVLAIRRFASSRFRG